MALSSLVPEAVRDIVSKHLLVIAIGLVFSYVAVSYVVSYRRLSHIPGPRLAAWTNLWWFRCSTTKQGHLHLYNACKEYGSLVRVAPNTLVTSDTDLIRRMNAVKSPYVRGQWYRAFRFDSDKDNLFSQIDKAQHERTRKKLVAGYSGKDNPYLEPDMDQILWNMIELINTKYISKGDVVKPLDLSALIQYLTLDTITALSSGMPFGWLEEDGDKYEFNATMEKSAVAMYIVASAPILNWFVRLPAVQKSVLPSIKDPIGMGKVKAVAREKVAERFRPGAEKVARNDMVQSFIDHELTQTEIADESVFQIVAGSDTTGVIIRTMLLYCISNPQIYRRLKEEVMSINQASDKIIPFVKVSQLPYLNACMKETMRYHPVNTGLLPKTVGPEGDHVNGHYLPPGTNIGICAWQIYRHNPVYGPDAGVFRPERWLEADPEKLSRMDREHELIFWYGAYKCLGERIARIEIFKTMFELLRRYDFSLLDPINPLEKHENWGLWVIRGMMVRVEEASK